MYPDDHWRWYASLSLVDLVDVFVRVDIFRESCLDFTAGCFDTTDTKTIISSSGSGDCWSRQDISERFSCFGK